MNETLREIEKECERLMERSPSPEVVTLANCVKGLAVAIGLLENEIEVNTDSAPEFDWNNE